MSRGIAGRSGVGYPVTPRGSAATTAARRSTRHLSSRTAASNADSVPIRTGSATDQWMELGAPPTIASRAASHVDTTRSRGRATSLTCRGRPSDDASSRASNVSMSPWRLAARNAMGWTSRAGSVPAEATGTLEARDQRAAARTDRAEFRVQTNRTLGTNQVRGSTAPVRLGSDAVASIDHKPSSAPGTACTYVRRRSPSETTRRTIPAASRTRTWCESRFGAIPRRRASS